MTRAGDLYDDTDIRKHYKLNHSENHGFQCPHKDCGSNGKQEFYHRLEDFLVHFKLHTNKSAEIPNLAAQSSVISQEQFPKSHIHSLARTLVIKPGSSRSPQVPYSDTIYENSTVSQGGRPVATFSATPVLENLKELGAQKRQASLKLLPKSEKKVSRSLEGRSPQLKPSEEPAVDTTVTTMQPQPR
jgi:hypothetical protein